MEKIQFVMRLPLQPKERPRFSRHNKKPHKSTKYDNWLSDAAFFMRGIYRGAPLECCRLSVDVHGEARSDLDNLVGALMDAGTGIVWRNDSVVVIPELNTRFFRAKKSEAKWVVCVEPLQ